MDLQLLGKRAIVMGGSRGIGRAIAETLASEGVDVAICARNRPQVDEAVASLRSKGVKAFGGVVDIADGSALKTWIRQAAETLGGLEILISNASALTRGNTEEEWKSLFDIDLMGSVRAFDAARTSLAAGASQGGDAAFIIISSISAAEASGLSAYGAIKASLIHVAKGLAREHAASGVRVNVVSPGTVYFEDGVWGEVERTAPAFFKTMLGRNPTGRMATPQEIASATVFLASPLSKFTTGTNLIVDGALTSRVNF
jgi:3-oxoacyl-[acyl-carrier protein] reductase